MPDDLLTPDAVSHAPEAPETRAADEPTPHDVAPPSSPPAPEAAHEETPPAPVEVPPAAPAAPVEAAAPPPPPNPEPMAPAAHRGGRTGRRGRRRRTAAAEPVPEPSNKHWYVVKVQSGREDTIKEAIERRVKIERLEEFFGEIRIPVERVTEMRNGKRIVKERKMYPGYLMANVEYNDRVLYLFRETSGVGDFVGGTLNRPPPPMSPREVERMLGGPNKGEARRARRSSRPNRRWSAATAYGCATAPSPAWRARSRRSWNKLNHLKVELTIFGRPVSVELEYWQVETV